MRAPLHFEAGDMTGQVAFDARARSPACTSGDRKPAAHLVGVRLRARRTLPAEIGTLTIVSPLEARSHVAEALIRGLTLTYLVRAADRRTLVDVLTLANPQRSIASFATPNC